MKRLFQRSTSGSPLKPPHERGNSQLASDRDSTSPERRGKSDHARHSYSPERSAAAFTRGSSPNESTKVRSNDVKPPDTRSAAANELAVRSFLLQYMTSTSFKEQQAAMRDLHQTSLNHGPSVFLLIDPKDAERLVRLSSQRLRLALQRRHDDLSSDSPPIAGNRALASVGDDGVQGIVSTLEVLTELLRAARDSTYFRGRVRQVVSERLPSTLVKGLKASSVVSADDDADGRIADATLIVLMQVVCTPEAVQELLETSTFHRLFLLRYNDLERQFKVVEVLTALLAEVEGALWDSVLSHLTEYRCVIELTGACLDLRCLCQVIHLTSTVLHAARARKNYALFAQLRHDQFYTQLFSALETIYRRPECVSNDGNLHDSVCLAIGALCGTGEYARAPHMPINDESFQLCRRKFSETAETTFNSEAFALLCQVVEFLHIEVLDEKSPTTDRGMLLQDLECLYIQKIGRLVVEDPRNYIFVQRSGILVVLLQRLGALSEVTQHAVGSVLAAIAIEAEVMPFAELKMIGKLLHPTASVARREPARAEASDLKVLALFLTNLLRFHEGYRPIFRSMGLLDTIIQLLSSVTGKVCCDEVAATRISVAHPTARGTPINDGWSNDWPSSVNEENLIVRLSSHCRQSSSVHKPVSNRHVDRSAYEQLLELLVLLVTIQDEDRSHLHQELQQESALFEVGFLECVCTLLAHQHFQGHAVQLWVALLQVSFHSRSQRKDTYNVINCYLQSLRYVALSLYYIQEPEITFAFKGSTSVLSQGIERLEELVHPSVSGVLSVGDRDRASLVAGLIECDAILTCLSLVCALTKCAAAEAQRPEAEPFVRLLRLLYAFVSSDSRIADQFVRCVTYGFLGDLIQRYLRAKLLESGEGDDQREWTKSVSCLVGWAIGNLDAAHWEKGCLMMRATEPPMIEHPGAIGILLQLVRLWDDRISPIATESILRWTAATLMLPQNARRCAQVELWDAILRCFASQDRSGSTSQALLKESSPYHGYVISMLKEIGAAWMPHSQAARWINLIAKTIPSKATFGTTPHQDASPLLALLLQVTKTQALHDVTSVKFELSVDGYAQMQIPEVLVRAVGAYGSQLQHTQSSSSNSASQVVSAKVWPPTDGYSVMVWVRIDAGETKDEREKHYWSLSMSNRCVLCNNALRDESSLKCSHRACKACLDALVNSGGECVVCNPPMFFLFRFRSGDAKSVSELFLRGSRLCMRTSAGIKTGIVQFNHPPLAVGSWYHVAVVHAKQRFQSSQASLYINGVHQESVKVSYPSSINSGQPLSGLIGIPSQARRKSSARWSLGPFYLIDDSLSGDVINAVYTIGPRYSGLFYGSAGNNEVAVCGDQLQIDNLLLLDEYTRDPMRTLLESVEAAERTSKSSILRGSLSLASAASSTAAAIVHDIKSRTSSGSSVFSRLSSAVSNVDIPIAQDRVLLLYSANLHEAGDASVLQSGNYDGRPLAQLLGGAIVNATSSVVSVLSELCGSGAQLPYVLLEHAESQEQVEQVLELLWHVLRGHPANLRAMEAEHGYGVVNYLLHQKSAAVLSENVLRILFRIAGIEPEYEAMPRSVPSHSESAIRNLHAMQHFIFDHSLWQDAPPSTKKLLFSTLYTCLMAGGDDRESLIRERNRTQLQALSLVRQLLYIFLDTGTENDSLRVIADLILVCLTAITTGGSTASSRSEVTTIEEHFAEVASFLSCTLSSNFGRRSVDSREDGQLTSSRASSRFSEYDDPEHQLRSSEAGSPVERLCLSPRGNSERVKTALHIQDPVPQPDVEACDLSEQDVSLLWTARSSLSQELLLDILTKAVQKHDLKENREKDEVDGLYVEGSASSQPPALTAPTGGIGNAAQRLQLPYSSRMSGFRKVLSPRWIAPFLILAPDWPQTTATRPSTVISALKLLAALLARPKYESAFRKEGYYRVLAHGLPCDHREIPTSSPFRFELLWYTLLCILLGPPVDGIPEAIAFEMFFLTKDFEVNLQRDRLINANIVCIMLAVCRRHYDDGAKFEKLKELTISPEKSMLDQVSQALYAADHGELYHVQLLDFLTHIYETMPAFKTLLVFGPSSGSSGGGGTAMNSTSNAGGVSHSGGSGSDSKIRGDILEELSLLACSAARAELISKYLPAEKAILRELLQQKRELNGFEFATCAIQLSETLASDDSDGEDPFQHAIAQKAIRLLAMVLCDYLVLHPRGVGHVEAFFAIHVGAALSPPLHEGLQLRFESLVMLHLVEQIRGRLADESCVVENKPFASNIRDFMALAVQSMQVWQRAQHGDACPKLFACTGDKVHFAAGPLALLDLALFTLGENSAVTASVASSSVSSPSTLGQLIQDKLGRAGKTQKRRHTIRNMLLGKVAFGASSKNSAELDGLASAMYATVNAVILHVLQGHGSDVSNDECETLLQLIHAHRHVVLSPRNLEDKEFFVCLSRFVLQQVSTKNQSDDAEGDESSLRELAAQVWIDLMELQRAFMVELLTVELKRAGGAPYMVNLMKNGFDVLAECTHDALSGQAITSSAAFKRFTAWLAVVGPPLEELELHLDRVFVRKMVEAKETVREGWVAFHKQMTQCHWRDMKRFQSRFQWFERLEHHLFESLTEIQQTEFQRQIKWRQDRIDRQNFHARQWEKLRQDLMNNALRDDGSEEVTISSTMLLSEIIASDPHKRRQPRARRTVWQLDAVEGPSRMRKRLVAKIKPDRTDQAPAKSDSVEEDDTAATSAARSPVRRRRFSDSDMLLVTSQALVATTSAETVQASHIHSSCTAPLVRAVEDKRRSMPVKRLSRRVSFEDLLQRGRGEQQRKDSALSGATSDDEEDARDALPQGNWNDRQAGPVRSQDKDDDAVDEKLRPLLVPGDEIVDMYDCLRVDGMDACPGVFILCSDHVYIVDNYQLASSSGTSQSPALSTAVGSTASRVMEVSRDVPTKLERRLSLRFQLPSSMDHNLPATPAATEHQPLLTPGGRVLTVQRSSFTHQCRYWAYEDIIELHKRRHQLRHVALELFAHDGRNYLITFDSPQQREHVFHSLIAKCPNVRGAANGIDRIVASGDLYSQLRKLVRQNMTERWIAREISNFEYLMHLNTLAGRSYNDLTQYPVFPWVLADYSSQSIDLSDPAVYRDLSKPMGALYREDEFRARYESLAEDTDNPMAIKPFHYGTHYSSAGIVLHYLVRIEPFTTHFLRLQGGKFDHADRLFSSVAAAWKSAAGVDSGHNGTQDVKELIPEFFYLPAFLENINECDFGRDQSGTVVDNVELPPWANGSAREFVRINREALESHHVSANLHHWIDLVFGYAQQGPAAEEACNVFYHLTYEGAVDLDAISDATMRHAMVDQISEFGQTPSQLFKTPHPPRVRLAGAVHNPSTMAGEAGVVSSSVSDGGATIDHASQPPSAPSSGGLSRAALASSFIEGSDLVSRMHSILTNGSSLGSASLTDDSTVIVDHAAMLQQDPRREVGANFVVAAYRSYRQQLPSSSSTASPPKVMMRPRQVSSGVVTAAIRQIAMASASVTRDERVAVVSDHCLLIPPRHHEFFAWQFQDRSLKILTTGPAEVASGSESKILASFEIEFAISVACMTADGRTLIAGGARAPVLRLWQFSSSKKSILGGGGVSGAAVAGGTRKRAYSVGLHAGGHASRSLTAIATLATPSHEAAITAVQACRAFSVIVSGCAMGNAVLWDLNRLRYVRTLALLHKERAGISAIAINERTGDIVVASGVVLGVYDVNGELLTRLNDSALRFDTRIAPITCVAVNKSEASEWCREKAVITGHGDGTLCVWAYSHTASDGHSDVGLELKARHAVTKSITGGAGTSQSPITAVLLANDERKLYTGSEDGLLSLWTPSLPGNAPPTPTKTLTLHAASLL